MKIELSGKVALVTGAARGIGKAIADALAANSAEVIYTDVDVDTVEESAAKTESRAIEMDVTDENQVKQVIEQVVGDSKSLDVLVNNAGVNTMEHRVPIDQFPREEWDRIINVDLNGLYLVSKAGATVMRKQGSGRIINIASIAGLVPLRLQCGFIAAKAGVVNLTRAMAIELASAGILVNAIAPGSTLTDGTRELFYGDDGRFTDSVQQLLDHIPLGRPAEVEEIAQGALFLADPDNSYMTGHILTVDGGWTAGYVRDF